MKREEFVEFINKHCKKLLPLLFIAPMPAGAQQNKQVEKVEIVDSVETVDTVVTHPKYDPTLKPYVAETYKDLPEMTVEQAVINPHKTYIGYFDSKGKIHVILTDCRYCAAPDSITYGVFRAECAHYTQKNLTLQNIKGRAPKGFTSEEYYDYVKSPNNTLGEVIIDYCNFRKSLVNTPKGRKSIVVRAGFFQAGVNEWKDCLRAAFCSPDEYAQKFASNFIENTPENIALRDSVIKTVYKGDELISGEEGIEKRKNIRHLFSKIRVNGLSSKIGKRTCLSEKFCDLLKYYTRKPEFDSEQETFEYTKISKSVKKLQENYLLGWYLLTEKGNAAADLVDICMAKQLNEKISSKNKKITAKQVKERNFGIYAGAGTIMGCIESKVNSGPYYKGFYPLTEKILRNFMKPFNKNKLYTENFLKQAVLVGISGAETAYKDFLQQKEYIQQKEKNFIKRIEPEFIKNPTPSDAVRQTLTRQPYIQPLKINQREQKR